MLNDIKIKNTDELEFAVFCIENIAMSLKKWYRALTEKSDILNSYVIPEYEMLHTQSKEYICLLYTSPSPRDSQKSRMPSSA